MVGRRSWWDGSGAKAQPVGQDGLGDPPGGPGVVGGHPRGPGGVMRPFWRDQWPSRKAGWSREVLLESQEWSGGPAEGEDAIPEGQEGSECLPGGLPVV